MKSEQLYWVVKDSEGMLRPTAGIWIDKLDEKTGVNYGYESAQEYANKMKLQVVLCSLTEVLK